MATTLSLTTSYAGKLAGEIFTSALIDNPSIKAVNFVQNIEYKAVARTLADTVTFAAGTCDFTPTGTITLGERILTLEEFQVQRQICKKDFFTDWTAADVMSGKLNSELQDAIVKRILAGTAANIERIMWQGVNATTGEWDGFETLIDANAGNDINFVASPVALTSSNIQDKIWALIAATPDAVKGAAEKPVIYMNISTWELFMQSQMAAGNGWYISNGPEVKKMFAGMYEIRVAPGMSDNKMIMTQPSNLWLGTWKEGQANSVKILDMEDLDASQNIRFSLRFYMGAQLAVPADITAYGPGLS